MRPKEAYAMLLNSNQLINLVDPHIHTYTISRPVSTSLSNGIMVGCIDSNIRSGIRPPYNITTSYHFHTKAVQLQSQVFNDTDDFSVNLTYHLLM